MICYFRIHLLFQVYVLQPARLQPKRVQIDLHILAVVCYSWDSGRMAAVPCRNWRHTAAKALWRLPCFLSATSNTCAWTRCSPSRRRTSLPVNKIDANTTCSIWYLEAVRVTRSNIWCLAFCGCGLHPPQFVDGHRQSLPGHCPPLPEFHRSPVASPTSQTGPLTVCNSKKHQLWAWLHIKFWDQNVGYQMIPTPIQPWTLLISTYLYYVFFVHLISACSLLEISPFVPSCTLRGEDRPKRSPCSLMA